MKFIDFLKSVSLLTLFVLAVSSTTFGQTTYYVNDNIGLDGYDGLHQTVTGVPGQGPKRTISNAITAASAGDIISVEAFAAYLETLTVDKNLTFQATGGSVAVTGIPGLILNNAAASPNDLVTFGGAYSFANGAQLIDGRIAGGSNVTVGTTLQITKDNGVSVDAQLAFTGAVAFSYTGPGGNYTTGYELPAAGNSTNFGSLTTAAGINLTFNDSKTITGAVTTLGTLNLNGGTLTLSGGVVHSLGGNVTNGTIDFSSAASTTATVGETAVSNLPNVIVSGGNASGKTVIINTTGTVGNITVTGTYINLTVASATTVGNVSNGSTGTATYGILNITLATTVGTVMNTSTGSILLGAAGTIGAITNSGRGTLSAAGVHSGNTGNIIINTPGAVTVAGSVELNSVVTSATQAGGNILFNTAGAVTINGNVTNNLNQTVAIATSSGTPVITQQDGGLVLFANNFAVTVNGSVTNNAVMGGTITTSAAQTGAFQMNGDIRFNATSGVTTITGSLTNAANAAAVTLTGAGTETYDLNGRITFAATGAANAYPAIVNSANFDPDATNSGLITFAANGSAVTAASVLNSSTSTTASNGMIDFGAGAGTVTVTGTVTSSGAAGGDIQFPNSNLTFTTITNQRTVAGADILLGSAGTASVTVNASDVTNSGVAKIVFNSTTDGNVTLSGKIENSGTGSILFPNLTTASVTAGAFNISAGTVNLAGAGAATGAVVVKNITFDGGTVALGTGVRNFTVAGPSNTLGATVFTGGGLTTLILAAPTPTVQQSLTIGSAGAVWPGWFDINNGTGLAEAVIISGGNLRVLGNVSFTAGFTVINGVNQKLFIGREAAPTATGNFTNTSGYRTDNNAFVSVNGAAASVVSGAGVFGNFEVDAAAGASVAGKFVSVFNLANGTVTGGAAVNFDNSTVFPTIVRNSGIFSVAPTFTSMVNVYYIGVDKVTANELPIAANKLNDLTVATTNGAVAGKGVVNVGVATTVNGTLTVNPNQALLLNGVDLTLNGASVVVNGDIVNVNAADQLVFNKTAGTTVTGSGWLPDLMVASGSSGNVINGSKGLVTNFLGVDQLRGGGDDFDPTTASASGSISYGAGTAVLSVAFGTGALNGSNLNNITTVNAGNTLTVAANMTQAGDISHTAGAITVDSSVVWNYRGLAPVMTGGTAAITGKGTLTFLQSTGAANNVTLTVNTAAGTIAIQNFNINLGAAADLFTVATNALTLSGNVTVTRGNFVLGQNVTVTGSALTLTTNSSVSGGSILRLNPTTPPLTFSYTGSPTISNLTISNDVVLGGTGTGLSVGTAFLHNGGNLNFADRDLTIDGTFTRTAGTYTATTGKLIIAGGSFAKGTTAFTIPNLRIESAGAFATTGAGVVTVTKSFDLANTGVFTQRVSGSNTLAIADSAVVTFVSGDFDEAPTYIGSIQLVLENAASSTVPAKLWTATVPVTDLTVDCAPFIATIPGNRLVSTNYNLISGTLARTGSNVLSTGAGANIVVVDGFMTGAFAPGASNNISYLSSGAYSTGVELPSAVNNFTIGRNGNIANAALTVNKIVAIAGTLTINNDVTMGTNGRLNAAGNVLVSDGTGSNATPNVLSFVGLNNALTFTGTTQNFTLGGDKTINYIELNQIGTAPTVTMTGGNLTIPGNITLRNGLLVVPDLNNAVILAAASIQGFTRPVPTNLSHIVGNVTKSLSNTVVRYEFPTGSMTNYRKAVLEFPNGILTPSPLTVRFVNQSPGGVKFDSNALARNIDSTSNFSWLIKSTISMGISQTFNLELYAEGYNMFTNVDDATNKLRAVRRLDTGVENTWQLQTGAYSNFVTSIPAPYPVLRVSATTGGIVAEGSHFSFGLEAIAPSQVQLFTPPNGATLALQKATLKWYSALKIATYSLQISTDSSFAGASLVVDSTNMSDTLAVEYLTPNTKYYWKIFGKNADGLSGPASDIWSFTTGTIATGVELANATIPTVYSLDQNYPNPFNPSTRIEYSIPQEGFVSLKVYDILGKEVSSLVNSYQPAGRYSVQFDASNLPSGVYIYRIESNNFTAVKKLMLLK